MRAPLLLLMLSASATAFSGCALLGKNDPLVPRYFTPEYEGDALAAPPRSELHLRLGRVQGSSHLRERLVVRGAVRELYYDEDRRWTERPEVYLRQALARTLFEERGVVEALSGHALTLEVELLAFEEVEQPHKAVFKALVVLRDDRFGLLEETITAEQPVATGGEGDPLRATVDAYSLALRAGVTRIADRVVARLVEQEARSPK